MQLHQNAERFAQSANFFVGIAQSPESWVTTGQPTILETIQKLAPTTQYNWIGWFVKLETEPIAKKCPIYLESLYHIAPFELNIERNGPPFVAI